MGSKGTAGHLPGDVAMEDILQFSKINGIEKILADIPETEELPEQYKQAGFNRIYLYRCYQKQEEKSSQSNLVKCQEEIKKDFREKGGLRNGFAE